MIGASIERRDISRRQLEIRSERGRFGRDGDTIAEKDATPLDQWGERRQEQPDMSLYRRA